MDYFDCPARTLYPVFFETNGTNAQNKRPFHQNRASLISTFAAHTQELVEK
jgi:hypothetical protein